MKRLVFTTAIVGLSILPAVAQQSSSGKQGGATGPAVKPPEYERSATEDMTRAVPPMKPGEGAGTGAAPGTGQPGGWTADQKLRATGEKGAVEATPGGGGQGTSASSSSSAQMGQSTGRAIVSADKLRQNLEQAGFKDVTVVDAAYLVHAQTKDGDFVLMLIDPPGGPAFKGASGQVGSAGQGQQAGTQAQSGQQELKQSLEKAGYSSVAIVDAAYLVHAKTSDGSMVRMTINPPSPTSAGMGGSASTGAASGGSSGSGSTGSSGSTSPKR